ncbi:MAG TPA: hypothetical protein P5318_18510 [Candidatus Hydrogenedentes bacterium]|nr:hypothetical protein [Candidatus Hydrogenedentota bacterium]HRT64722.1 hypothetical protein [Candidatus Hydrogenedentota bacterium]
MTVQSTMKNPTKRELTRARRNLLEQMQALNFGRIRNIQVIGGEPRFTPMTKIERQIRFGGDNQPRPEAALEDFALKDKVVELFDAIERLGDGLILKLEIKGGLPFDMTVEEQAV